MEAEINQFLLVFDRGRDELVETHEFGTNVAAALAEYSRLERLHMSDAQMDIVLVGSDSLETFKVTHSTYFPEMGSSDLSALLRLDEAAALRR